jgi:hypothetical protein
VAFVSLLGGVGLGLWYGWIVDPVEYKDTDIAHLAGIYRDDYILMVSEAYALDGSLDDARARMALLSLPDPANAVADAAEAALARDASLMDIQALARLATAMGAQRDVFRPYLAPADEIP